MAKDNLGKLLCQSGINQLLCNDAEMTTRHLALVQGGRARNESGGKVLHRGLAISADISGAYATAMKQIIYPIGLPTTISFPLNCPDKWLTIKRMLKKYGSEFVDGLWFAVIDSVEQLSFDQDLIFSKCNPKLTGLGDSKDDDDGAIKADFGLHTREIENGVLTSSTLEIINKVATKQERAELMKKLRVKALIYYPNSKRCDNPEELNQEIMAGERLSTSNSRSHSGNYKLDERSRAWLGVELSSFLDLLIEERKRLKQQRNQYSVDSDKYRELDAQQSGLKLVINTTYGTIASPYFDIGNVVVANNITALVRNVCWCMVKASNGKTAITDGSEAMLNQFAFLNFPNNRKLGLNVLSQVKDYDSLDRHHKSYIKLKPIGGGDQWSISGNRPKVNGDREYCLTNGEIEIWGSKDNWGELNQLYKQHMDHFADAYGLTFLSEFDYEIKDVYQDIALLNVANYGMRQLDGKLYVKVRGSKLHENIEGFNIHPRVQVYGDILTCKPVHPVPLYRSRQLVKVDGWRHNGNLRSNFLPGDSFYQMKFPTLISASQFEFKTYADRQWWTKRQEKLRDLTGYGLEYYLLNEDGSIDLDNIKRIQRMIDQVERPYLPQNPIIRIGYDKWKYGSKYCDSQSG